MYLYLLPNSKNDSLSNDYVVVTDTFVPWDTETHATINSLRNLLCNCNCNLPRNNLHNKMYVCNALWTMAIFAGS